MERYQHVVRFSSFGHTHDDEFFVNKAFNTEKPINWGLVHGSFTTFKKRQPAFSLIQWDAEYMVPVNVETYTFNVTHANLHRDAEPNWHLMHDMIKEYDIPDLSPQSMADLAEKLYENVKYA